MNSSALTGERRNIAASNKGLIDALMQSGVAMCALWKITASGARRQNEMCFRLRHHNALLQTLAHEAVDELLGRRCADIFPQEIAETIERHLTISAITGDTSAFDLPLPENLRGERTLVGSITPVFGDKGNLHGLLFTGMIRETQLSPLALADVPAVQNVEKMIQSFDRILAAGGNAVCVLDSRSRCVYSSTSWQRMAGYAPDMFQSSSFIEFVHPDDRSRISHALYLLDRQAAEAFPPLSYRFRHASGEWRWHETTMMLRRDSTRHARRIICFMRDITEQKLLEEKLQMAEFTSEIALRSRSEFLSSMSHELRTPLNAIIGFSEMMECQLLGPIENPTYLSYMHDIRESAQNLLATINDVLEISNVEVGEAPLREEAVDFTELLASTCEKQFARALRNSITLKKHLFSQPVWVMADGGKLKLALSLVLAAVLKRTAQGGTVTVGTRFSEEGDVLITLSDDALFSPSQLDMPGHENNNGWIAGAMGISLATRLIEMHNGKLETERNPRAPQVLTIAFPARRIIPSAQKITRLRATAGAA